MLTDTQCRTAKPKEKLYRLNDFNGLYLEVKPNGKKAWRYRFKLNGKSSMFALGEYPTVKLDPDPEYAPVIIRNNRLHVGCMFWQPADFSANSDGVIQPCAE